MADPSSPIVVHTGPSNLQDDDDSTDLQSISAGHSLSSRSSTVASEIGEPTTEWRSITSSVWNHDYESGR